MSGRIEESINSEVAISLFDKYNNLNFMIRVEGQGLKLLIKHLNILYKIYYAEAI
jgi:hypothetical protein